MRHKALRSTIVTHLSLTHSLSSSIINSLCLPSHSNEPKVAMCVGAFVVRVFIDVFVPRSAQPNVSNSSTPWRRLFHTEVLRRTKEASHRHNRSTWSSLLSPFAARHGDQRAATGCDCTGTPTFRALSTTPTTGSIHCIAIDLNEQTLWTQAASSTAPAGLFPPPSPRASTPTSPALGGATGWPHHPTPANANLGYLVESRHTAHTRTQALTLLTSYPPHTYRLPTGAVDWFC
ncbi:hypothetical protein B0J13DRAFT_5527 [Dactylonectria estremocensis]|uniref:Uncharacterized protein n=1 Tax=Dactylonectria estremocensis TaxID=1079267 RepID=A0A9P9JE87_9HYPO|nr:hypothetical protein B0J13DRAFT_5527 [Dactylonectria estremocensis]